MTFWLQMSYCRGFFLENFQKKNVLFSTWNVNLYTQWTYISMKEHLFYIIEEVYSQHHTIWSLRKKTRVPSWCLHHIMHYESWIYCMWRCLLMLEIEILFNLFVKDCMFTTPKTQSYEGCFIANFDCNLAYSRVWGSLTIGDGWPSTPFPFIGSLLKSSIHCQCIAKNQHLTLQ